MAEVFFIPLAILLEWCEQGNGGDREAFGLICPGDGVPPSSWLFGVDGNDGLEVLLSIQDIVDYSEEEHPAYALEKLTIGIRFQAEDDGEVEVSYFTLTEEQVKELQRRSLC